MATIPDWTPQSPKWSSETYNLLIEKNVENPKQQKLKDIVEKSNNFSIKFPVDTGRCKTLTTYVSDDTLERNINSVYPLIHENALELCCKFLIFKRGNGSAKEKSLYREMGLLDFIDRLLHKRAVMFMGRFDQYLLVNGEKGSKNWETIGTDAEKPPLVLQNCLSYDEIKLSVFLNVSSYTYFVNKGDRKNMAKYTEDRTNIEEEGVIVGMVGPRLKKDDAMEYQEIVISNKQNVTKNGYGTKVTSSIHTLFSDFYEEKCRDYEETLKFMENASKDRFTDLKNRSFFDNHLYFKRLVLTIDTMLMEANWRAKEKDTTAYLHVVGLGLGVWKMSDHQENVYMWAFAKRIKALAPKLDSISDICFSYMKEKACGTYTNGKTMRLEGHPTGIKIHIFKREPHTKLVGNDAGKLLVVSYAWDGNALPGNEFWSGKLGSSGDSATASSTQITELHNPHINPMVSADNLMIVTKDAVVPFGKYQESIRLQKFKRN